MNKQLLSILIFASSSIFAMEQEKKVEKNISDEGISSAINNIVQELATRKQISEIKQSSTLFALDRQYKNTLLQAAPSLLLQLEDGYNHLQTISASTLSSAKKEAIWALAEKNQTIQKKFLELLIRQKTTENNSLKNQIPMQFSITIDGMIPLVKQYHSFVIEYSAFLSSVNQQ